MTSNTSRQPQPFLETINKGRRGSRRADRTSYGDPKLTPEWILPTAGEEISAFEIEEILRLVFVSEGNADELVHWAEDAGSNWTAALEDSVRDAWATELDEAIRNLERVRRTLRTPVRVCERCDGRFTGRTDARFCSDTCRVAAHRNGLRPT